MLFVEGKRFYNHVLSMKKNGIKLRDINTTKIKEVKHFDKDKKEQTIHKYEKKILNLQTNNINKKQDKTMISCLLR